MLVLLPDHFEREPCRDFPDVGVALQTETVNGRWASRYGYVSIGKGVLVVEGSDHPDDTAGQWSHWRCPVPTDLERADAFLTAVLRPVMDGLQATDAFTSWYFERRPPGILRLHVHGADRAVFLARLTGLVFATQPHAVDRVGMIDHRPYRADQFGRPRWDPLLARRTTQLAMDVISSTPGWSARLRAGYDLAIATTVGLRIGSVSALVRLATRRPGEVPYDLTCPRDRDGGTSGRHHGARWRQVGDALRAGDGPVARWGGFVTEARLPSPEAGFALLRLLDNQLGLRPEDEHRIYGTLVMSVLAPRHRDGGRRATRRALRRTGVGACAFGPSRGPDPEPRQS